MAEQVPRLFLAALTDLIAWLEAGNVPSVVIGGIAASILGRPRLTQDIDALAVLPQSDWLNFMVSAERHGIVPRIDGAIEFAARSRVLLMRHQASNVDIDITFGGLAFEEMTVRNGKDHEIDGVRLRLPRVEDLLIMKAIAHRPKDLHDIEGLLSAHPEADLEEVRQWIREFSVALSMSDILDDFEKLLERRKES